jgi:6,7-dimethyl-8-ribityllumazine synthase
MTPSSASDPSAFRIAFVQAEWHRELTDGCRQAFLTEMASQLPDARIEPFDVPGALEIPLRAKLLAQTGRYDAVVASALVVDGGIYRHEFVAQAVLDGLMRVQLEAEVPVLSAVLTPQRFDEHDPGDVAFFTDHLVTKGVEVAQACADLLQSGRQLAASA